MKITLTKKQLIAIVRREPMKAGSWISRKPESTSHNVVEDCVGCAVGAIICSQIDPKEKVNSYGKLLAEWIARQAFGACQGSESLAFLQIEAGNYLAALSHYFEAIAVGTYNLNGNFSVIKHHSHPIKKKLVAFIQKNFPESIEVDIDGFKPREKKTRKKAEVTNVV